MKPLPYGRQSIGADDVAAVCAVLRSDFLTQGPKVREFEAALCHCTGAKYAVSVSNGTAALHLACLAAELGRGDEVITSPMTFAASANCARYCGAKPVFADVQPDTLNIDPAQVRERISRRTKALIPVHFAGHSCDMRELGALARRHRLLVIEDACHALGGSYRGAPVGSCAHSDMAAFSFHPVKPITTGEGGAVTTNRKDLYQRLLLLRTHGITKDPAQLERKDMADCGWYYEMQALGFNFRITDIQCALGLSQLKKLARFTAARRRIAALYARELRGVPEVVAPVERADAESAWHLYPIRLRDAGRRKEVFQKLRRAGIGTQVHYIPVYQHPYYRKLGYPQTSCPRAQAYYEAALSLPIYPDLRPAEVRRVVRTLEGILRGKAS